jgi:hypothetical protein
MLVLLPPSETKHVGGTGEPLDLSRLSWPELSAVRARLVEEVSILAKDPAAARAALGLSAGQDDQIALDRVLTESPTMPALRRYTGVLYDALDAGSLKRAALARAQARIAVGSALFGLVRAGDPIPAYRLSASSVLPGTGRLTGLWRPAVEPVLAAVDELVVDLRSGAYADLARCPAAITVRVLTERPDGRRTVVSHFNKATKGLLARALATAAREPQSLRGVCSLARRAGLQVERTGPATMDVLTG